MDQVKNLLGGAMAGLRPETETKAPTMPGGAGARSEEWLHSPHLRPFKALNDPQLQNVKLESSQVPARDGGRVPIRTG